MSYEVLCTGVVADCVLGNWSSILHALAIAVSMGLIAGVAVGIILRTLRN